MPQMTINDLPKTYRRSVAAPLPATVKPLEGIIDGYPIVFNQRTNIGDWFYEEIDPHALDDADLSDIKFLINHDDTSIPIARHRRGKRSTMDVEIDNIGMHIETKLDIENNATSRAVCSAVDRGDIEDMSFAFVMVVSGEEWSDLDKPMPIRRITKIAKIPEISAVNDGAYPQTSINARSADTLDNEKTALDNARAAALENENRAKEQAKAQAALRLEKEKFLFLEDKKQ
jgi:HK97 family phage prohead protease